jgi:5-oxoprolinase (ATP-hydrolysing) subunit A
MTIDLNCDMGEGIGHDAVIMPYISSANIACGYHAGDEVTMRKTVRLAIQHGVSIGAHPSYPDKENFGRRAMILSAKEIYDLTITQISLLNNIAKAEGASLSHVKPHGALYNASAVTKNISDSIVSAIQDFDPSLILYGLANSEMIRTAQTKGLKFKQEVFADRTYQLDGTLTPRTQPNALIESEQESISQVMQMIQTKTVTVLDGLRIPIQADTLCIHGDGTHAVEFAQALHTLLKSEGFTISAHDY